MSIPIHSLTLPAAPPPSQLGTLADPSQHSGPLAPGTHLPAQLIRMLHEMTRIRLVENTLAAMAEAGEIKGPLHLTTGQEAVAVGVAAYLRKTDRAFGSHRSHGHYLAMGGNARALLAEALGKATGCSGGFGGSMHLCAREVGFYGSAPIVGGTIALAAGAAIAAKFDGKGDIAVAFFGDGASEEGVFHETLNLASLMRLPMLFIAENNLFSSHLDLHLRQPSNRIARFADAACMEQATIDGNDVIQVSDYAAKLVENARRRSCPALLECVTYRWHGHVGPRADMGVGERRTPEDIKAWKARDPIERLLAGLVAAGHCTRQAHEAFTASTKKELDAL
ncbi:MAG: thiamine pyrophosphate-dependent dehydrogenase E1 component subunit alpha, partial [Pseudomonadota bacterium]|nr:thiamine pyrophosphate-dependent dehydrogenase E1 component subunit alpha [Pseudomonadota bacterium]